MLCEVIEQIKNDGVIVTLSSHQKIDVTGDRSINTHWLPVIKRHKQEIIQQLTERDNNLEKIQQWFLSIGEPDQIIIW